MKIKLSYNDWVMIGANFGFKKLAQDLGAPPGGAPGGAGGGSVGGTISGVDSALIDRDEKNDSDLLDKLNNAFRRALKAGRDFDDALLVACQAVNSRVFPDQLDIDMTKDPPDIRGWSGLDLGPSKPAPAAPPAGGALGLGGMPPPPMM